MEKRGSVPWEGPLNGRTSNALWPSPGPLYRTSLCCIPIFPTRAAPVAHIPACGLFRVRTVRLLCLCIKCVTFDLASSSSFPFFYSSPNFILHTLPLKSAGTLFFVPLLLMSSPLACLSCTIHSMPSFACFHQVCSPFFEGGALALGEEE